MTGEDRIRVNMLCPLATPPTSFTPREKQWLRWPGINIVQCAMCTQGSTPTGKGSQTSWPLALLRLLRLNSWKTWYSRTPVLVTTTCPERLAAGGEGVRVSRVSAFAGRPSCYCEEQAEEGWIVFLLLGHVGRVRRRLFLPLLLSQRYGSDVSLQSRLICAAFKNRQRWQPGRWRPSPEAGPDCLLKANPKRVYGWHLQWAGWCISVSKAWEKKIMQFAPTERPW